MDDRRLVTAAIGMAVLLALSGCTSPLQSAGLDDDDTTDDPTDAPPVVPPELLIITVPDLAQGAEAYAEYRESTGFVVQLVTTEDLVGGESLVDAIHEHVRQFALTEPTDVTRSVLLIGDADETAVDDPAFLPQAPAEGAMGDTPYADLDGDGVLDLGIGRLPYSDPALLENYLAQVQRVEADPHVGQANHMVRMFAGESGFGDAVDQAIEIVATSIVGELSYDFDLEVTYSLASSPFYLPDDAWYDEYTAVYREGSLFQPYIGHTLAWLPTDDLEETSRPGVVAFLSCSDGAFQRPDETSLAEALLAVPAPPLGVIAANQVSQPCGNALLAREFGHAVMNERASTVGELMVLALNNTKYRQDDLRVLIAGFCDAFSEEPMEQVVASHLVMYALLGDPTVATASPSGEVSFDVGLSLPAGETVTVTGQVWSDRERTVPMDQGEIAVSLETDRGTIPGELVDTTDQDPESFILNHTTANDHVLAHASAPVNDGWFEVVLEIPVDAEQGDTYLKAYANTDTVDAVGSMRIGIGG